MKIELTKIEEESFLKFKEEHKDCKLPRNPWWKRIFGFHNNGPFPDHFELGVSFCSGIGVGYTARCNYCGGSEDITDYGAW